MSLLWFFKLMSENRNRSLYACLPRNCGSDRTSHQIVECICNL